MTIPEPRDKRFYGKYCAVMIQYLTFRKEELVSVAQLCFQIERIRTCIGTKALIAHNVEIICLILNTVLPQEKYARSRACAPWLSTISLSNLVILYRCLMVSLSR